MNVRDRRALLLGAAVLLPAFLYIWGIKPFRAALSDTRDRIASERELLTRERAAVLAAQRAPERQLLADSAMRATAPRLFPGRDDVMASAELVTYLGDAARRSHVWLQDAGTRPASTAAGGVRALHVEIRGESDLQGILIFLQELERGGKLVTVERIDLSRSGRVGKLDDVETISLAASIVGFSVGADMESGTAATPARPAAATGQGGAP
jgi:hypothetical protein